MQESDLRLREQIDILRFLLVSGLVFLHYGRLPGSNYDHWDGVILTEHPIATFVNSYFYFFFLSSVPLLSAISGYLFFRDADYTVSFYTKRYRSRTRSVLLPMISWNAIALVLSGIVLLLYPGSKSIISYNVFDLRWKDLVNALLGLTRHPADFQFWFLHDLFLTVLLSPLLGIFLRRAPWIGLAGLFVIWITSMNVWPPFFRSDVFFFFYIGAMIRVQKWSVEDLISPRAGLLLMATFAAFVALRTVAPLLIPKEATWGATLLDTWNHGLRLLGIAALWGVAPLLPATSPGRLLARIGVLAFFLHAIHWPMNQLIKSGIDRLLPGNSDFALLVNFFGTTFLTILLAIGIAWVLNAVVPSVFDHLSGGRSSLWAARARGPRAVAVPVKIPHGGVG